MKNDSELIFDAALIREKGGLKVSKPLDAEIFAGIFMAPDKVSEASMSLVFSVGGESLLLEGSVKAGLRLKCARCGEFFSACFSEAFDEVYEDAVESIDVRGPLMESVALMPPLKPVCAPGCKGLCQACGGNLNLKACGCAAERAPLQDGIKRDSPFGALKNFPVLPPDGGKPGENSRK
jgi:uncharacterized protein